MAKKSISDFEKDLKETVRACSSEQVMHQVGTAVRDIAKGLTPTGTTGLLRNSIGYSLVGDDSGVTAYVGTNSDYAMYVEYGTGPKGAANHAGVSPEYSVAYRQDPWWVHESQLDPTSIERYHWFYIDTKDGKFYRISGQPAQPFLYPALKNNEEQVKRIIYDGLSRAVGKVAK